MATSRSWRIRRKTHTDAPNALQTPPRTSPVHTAQKHTRKHKDTATTNSPQTGTCPVLHRLQSTASKKDTARAQLSTDCTGNMHTHVQLPNDRNGTATNARKYRTRKETACAQVSEDCATNTHAATSHTSESLRTAPETHKRTAQVKMPWFGCRNHTKTPGVYFFRDCTFLSSKTSKNKTNRCTF